MKKYILTGAAGFIASRVAEFLLDEGHMVIGSDNLNDAYDVRMKEYRLKKLSARDGFVFHALDIADRAVLSDQVEPQADGVAAIINLAARAGVRASVENPWVYVDTNLTGTLNLLELSRSAKIPKFILASTSSVYGEGAPLPTPEDYDSNHPLQSYAATKKAAEVLTHAYHHLYGIDVTVFRYFTVYGPAVRPDMSVFRFVKWIAESLPLRLNGDGEQSRGFTFLDDIARGTILGLKPVGYEIFNLGGHENITINELIARIEELIGAQADVTHFPFHPADMRSNLADVSKARRILDWEPQVSLKDGLAACVEWYRREQDWAKEIETG